MINTELINEKSLVAAANYLNSIELKKFIPKKLRVVIPAKGSTYSYNIDSTDKSQFFYKSDSNICKNGWTLKLININVDCLTFNEGHLKFNIEIKDNYTFKIKRLNLISFSKTKVDNYERLLFTETHKYLEILKSIEIDRLTNNSSTNYISECYIVPEYVSGYTN